MPVWVACGINLCETCGLQILLEMAKGGRGRRRITSRQSRSAPYPLPSFNQGISEELLPKKCFSNKDWEEVTCSVCMECPHNAVLLLCSSHDKGCRPYMCGTSFRYSNCLDQYKRAYTKVVQSNEAADDPLVVSESGWPVEKCELTELACPLCRGRVKGWTVVEPAREYLNSKKRSCMQENCAFVGTFKELRKHMRADHPSARPRQVDPAHEQKWMRLEREREHDDVISTIRSTMPGAMVFGDYVIEGNHFGVDTDEDGSLDAESVERNEGVDRNLVNVIFLLHAFGPSGEGLRRRLWQPENANNQTTDDDGVGVQNTDPVVDLLDSNDEDENNSDDDNGDGDGRGDVSLVSRLRRHGRVLLGRSQRRRRRREANGGER